MATELATNLVKHASGGRIIINLTGPSDTFAEAVPHVQIISLDHGPGIDDIQETLRDGYTTSAVSLGAGLGTCLRISSDFDLHSRPGRGTVAMARVSQSMTSAGRRSRPVRSVTGARAGGVNTSLAHAEHSGDSFAWVRSGSRLTLMLADGLGHGEAAARASTAAVHALHATADRPPADILRQLHTALHDTRGAAVGVAQLDETSGHLSFAGVGNIGARLRTDGSWHALTSHPGIVGAHFPARVPLHGAAWQADSLLVLHSDGLPQPVGAAARPQAPSPRPGPGGRGRPAGRRQRGPPPA
ncbi:SpoIIE family protein phosphatase OS=Streptomyces tendae OX=1932 GN=F3L20_21480 PE=4 SV=1 [Streptomyces tendae]